MSDFDSTEYDTTVSRTFDAPREGVWAAWTDPDRVAEWWGPKDFTVPHCEMDVRPGGAFRIDMQAPDGTVYPSEGVFDEVQEPERLVLIGGAVEDDDGTYQLEVRQTVTFVDHGGATELTLEAEVVTATPDVVEHLEGMEEGWSQSLEKLAGYVETRPDEAEIETSETSLTVRRTFDAPRERVFDAWTDPQQVDRWWGPDGFATTTHEMEVRPGGSWEFEMVGPEGETFPNRIVYDEVEEPNRLAYGHGSPDEPEQFRVTVTFEEGACGGTELTMEIRFPSSEAFDEAVEFGAIEGAKQTMDKLAQHLSPGEVA